MLEIQESTALGKKTTMRIGGSARYYAELQTREDVEEAHQFAEENAVPLIVLGGGSNTVFANGEINALVVRIKADTVTIDQNTATVDAGKILAMLINELAEAGLDLSALTGIPGSVGGAIFGNAGQGPTGIWVDQFVESVTVFQEGEWKELSTQECGFAYRESGFKKSQTSNLKPQIIWSTTLNMPSRSPEEIKEQIEQLLQKRIETQPHIKTAGSCFKAIGDTPAWKLIDAAGFRGKQIGNIEVAEKHTNFLLNKGDATFKDAANAVEQIRGAIDEELEVEMRFVQEDGSLLF